MGYQKIGDICPHCENALLEFSPANEPWSPDHLTCPECYSTYNIKGECHHDWQWMEDDYMWICSKCSETKEGGYN